ncbi:MAG: NADH-quinone oxidoreductase subunit E [Bacteroidetes bacterium]|nr:NADH-quinone oxidoreductase subunit E [Bacteroidota bacterium]
MLVLSTSAWAIQAWNEPNPVQVGLGIATWSGEIILQIDKLSAFFILLINFICFMGIIYAAGYLQPYIAKKRSTTISLHLFSFIWLNAAMIMVTALNDGIAFLLAWELMSLTSFILVIFEAEKEETLKTGINYLLQMHFGFAMIMFGFLLVKDATGEMSFSALASYFAAHNNVVVFLAFFIGFGIKAGFIPLHTWLPRAHPAAPSHVSGVMSGVMIKMGIYGILRVTSYLKDDFMVCGAIVLVVAILSGILGVVLAIMQHDLKRLLAYHSIENIGIIGIGIGLSILGYATGDSVLASLAMAGALLHCVNHALFKSLLFFSTGNVYYAAHSVNMDRLGGLAGPLRLTSLAFLIGALAISGIPPFNGFVSEFLIYNGIVHDFVSAGFSMFLAGLAGFVSLALIGGLCLYCFTKAFGMTFLGTHRSAQPYELRSTHWTMLAALAPIVLAIVLIGIFPEWLMYPLQESLATFHWLGGTALTQTAPAAAMTNVSLINIIFLSVMIAIGLLKWIQQKKVVVTTGPTWGCGYTAGDYRHQYTPTSYADSLAQLAEPFVIFKKDYKVIGEEEIFPAKRTFHTESGDRIERSAIMKIIGFLVKYLPLIGRAQTGYIHHYLIYPMLFLALIALLTFLQVI